MDIQKFLQHWLIFEESELFWTSALLLDLYHTFSSVTS